MSAGRYWCVILAAAAATAVLADVWRILFHPEMPPSHVWFHPQYVAGYVFGMVCGVVSERRWRS